MKTSFDFRKVRLVFICVFVLLYSTGVCQQKSIWVGVGWSGSQFEQPDKQHIFSFDFNYQITSKVFLSALYNNIQVGEVKYDYYGTIHRDKSDAFGIGVGYFLKKKNILQIKTSSGVMLEIIQTSQWIDPSGNQDFSREYSSTTGFGIPIKIQLDILLIKWFGIGLIGQYMWSSKFSSYGYGFVLMFGRLK